MGTAHVCPPPHVYHCLPDSIVCVKGLCWYCRFDGYGQMACAHHYSLNWVFPPPTTELSHLPNFVFPQCLAVVESTVCNPSHRLPPLNSVRLYFLPLFSWCHRYFIWSAKQYFMVIMCQSLCARSPAEDHRGCSKLLNVSPASALFCWPGRGVKILSQTPRGTARRLIPGGSLYWSRLLSVPGI